MCFLDLQISKKNIPKSYPRLEIWISRQLYTVIGGKFKFQAEDSFLEYFFLRFGDLKNFIALSEKKPPLVKKNPLDKGD